MGALGYYSDLYIFDRYGLIDPRIANRELDLDEQMRSAGHDKMVAKEYFLNDRPTILQAYVLPSADKHTLVAVCQSEAAAMNRLNTAPPIPTAYVLDFARVPADKPTAEPQYIITWTRIADVVDYRAAWTDFENRLRAEVIE